ncbi:MAG TPA: SCO family protein [Casimicrobiaceae bacterium]|jgi:protein SCO1/2
MKIHARVLALVSGWFLVSACAAATLSAQAVADRVGFDQHLDATLPLGLDFRDEAGRGVHLGDYFGAAPVVLAFAYYGCSSLCPTVVGHLVDTLDRSGLTPGRGYRVIVASIDPGDSPALASMKKATYLENAKRPHTAEAWHLLTGSEANISALTQAAGFRYAYDADAHQYAHPAGIIVLTPHGVIARYVFGFEATPEELRSALNDAAAQRIASPAERLLLLCFHFAPSGRYSTAILLALRWITLAMLLALLAWFTSRRRRKRADASSPH